MTPREVALVLNGARSHLRTGIKSEAEGQALDAVIIAYCRRLGVDPRLLEATRDEHQQIVEGISSFIERVMRELPED